MRQINNGFKEYYYLTEEGEIYNARSRSYLKGKGGSYKLRAADDTSRYISISTLYELVYNKSFIQDDIDRLDGEIFQEIPGTEGKYLISNFGRCISYNQGRSARLLKPNCNRSGGYLRVCIKIDGSFKNKLIHQLVAQQFCEKPEGSNLQIHHIDFDHSNNQASNLEYLSMSDHIAKHLEREQQQRLLGASAPELLEGNIREADISL